MQRLHLPEIVVWVRVTKSLVLWVGVTVEKPPPFTDHDVGQLQKMGDPANGLIKSQHVQLQTVRLGCCTAQVSWRAVVLAMVAVLYSTCTASRDSTVVHRVKAE